MRNRLRPVKAILATAADAATLLALGGGLVGGAVLGAWLVLRSVGLGWAIVATCGAFLILTAGMRGLLSWLRNRTDEIGEESYLRQKRIRLTDLVLEPSKPIVTDRTFEECRFVGPALITFLDGTVVNGGNFEMGAWVDSESMLIEVPEGRYVVGVLAFKDCVLRNCTFHGVGIVGTALVLQKFRDALPPQPPQAPHSSVGVS